VTHNWPDHSINKIIAGLVSKKIDKFSHGTIISPSFMILHLHLTYSHMIWFKHILVMAELDWRRRRKSWKEALRREFHSWGIRKWRNKICPYS